MGARVLSAGSYNTSPLEVFGIKTDVTSPVLYALGTLTTLFSFAMIATFAVAAAITRRRRTARGTGTGKGRA